MLCGCRSFRRSLYAYRARQPQAQTCLRTVVFTSTHTHTHRLRAICAWHTKLCLFTLEPEKAILEIDGISKDAGKIHEYVCAHGIVRDWVCSHHTLNEWEKTNFFAANFFLNSFAELIEMSLARTSASSQPNGGSCSKVWLCKRPNSRAANEKTFALCARAPGFELRAKSII